MVIPTDLRGLFGHGRGFLLRPRSEYVIFAACGIFPHRRGLPRRFFHRLLRFWFRRSERTGDKIRIRAEEQTDRARGVRGHFRPHVLRYLSDFSPVRGGHPAVLKHAPDEFRLARQRLIDVRPLETHPLDRANLYAAPVCGKIDFIEEDFPFDRSAEPPVVRPAHNDPRPQYFVFQI